MNREDAQPNPAANSTVRQLSPVHGLEEDTVTIHDLVQQAKEANESFIRITAQIAQLSPSVSRGLGVSLNEQREGAISSRARPGAAEDVPFPSAVPLPRRSTLGTPNHCYTDREPVSVPPRSTIAFPDFPRYVAQASSSTVLFSNADQYAGTHEVSLNAQREGATSSRVRPGAAEDVPFPSAVPLPRRSTLGTPNHCDTYREPASVTARSTIAFQDFLHYDAQASSFTARRSDADHCNGTLGGSLNAQRQGAIFSRVRPGTAEDVPFPSAVPLPRRSTLGTPNQCDTYREPASVPPRSTIAFPDFPRYDAQASSSTALRSDADHCDGTLGGSLNTQREGAISSRVCPGTAEDVPFPSAVPLPRRSTLGTPDHSDTYREPASVPSRLTDADQCAGTRQRTATQPDRERDLQRALEDLEIQQLRERNRLMQFFEAAGHQRTTPQQPRVSIVPERLQTSSSSAFDPSQMQCTIRHGGKQDLPTFSGNPEEWPMFIASFEYTTEEYGYNDVDNLDRLQRALKGKALESVRSLLMHPSNVPNVMRALRMLYSRPEVIVHSLVNKVRAMLAPRQDRLDTRIDFGVVANEAKPIVSPRKEDESLRRQATEPCPADTTPAKKSVLVHLSVNAPTPQDANNDADGADEQTLSEDNEEVLRIVQELKRTQSCLLSEQGKVGELEEQLAAIAHENTALQSKLMNVHTSDIKSVRDVLSMLNEFRHDQVCARCLRDLDDQRQLEPNQPKAVGQTDGRAFHSQLDFIPVTIGVHKRKSRRRSHRREVQQAAAAEVVTTPQTPTPSRTTDNTRNHRPSFRPWNPERDSGSIGLGTSFETWNGNSITTYNRAVAKPSRAPESIRRPDKRSTRRRRRPVTAIDPLPASAQVAETRRVVDRDPAPYRPWPSVPGPTPVRQAAAAVNVKKRTMDDTPTAVKSAWKASQCNANLFWRKWVAEYLPTLTRRTRWFYPIHPMQEDDMVLIADNNLPRNCWPKGRVIEVVRAIDGQFRRATVQGNRNHRKA